MDGITIADFEKDLYQNLSVLQRELEQGDYSPLPLLKILVEKENGEARPLAIPTVRDRVAQAAVYQILNPLLEAEFEDCSFAYRPGRSVKQALYRVKEYRDKGYTWVVDLDIDDYFDNINHDLLLEKLKQYIADEKVLRLIRLWFEAEVYDGQGIFRMTKGIPQGSVISPLLANLFLDELDEELLQRGYRLVRYADDYLILCKTKDKAQEAMELTDELLAQLELELNPEKTRITTFDQGFRYLGAIFLKSMIMVPLKEKRIKRILYVPPPMGSKQ